LAHLLKNHGDEFGAGLGLDATRDGDIHGIGRIVPAELKPFERRRGALPDRLIDGDAQLRGMSLFDHLEQTEIGIATRKRQVLVGGTVKMQAIAAFINQDNGGIEILQQHILVQV